MIGTGTRALQVVSEGCVRADTGEVRTGNGLPVTDCPDWLADWLVADSKRLLSAKAAESRRRSAELRAALKEVSEDEAAARRQRTGYDKHARADRYRYLASKARTLSNAGVARQRLLSELLAQYVADYGDIRDGDPNGWPLAELNEKIQGIINNPELKRGNPPPIRPLVSTFPIIKRQPESNWERRVKMARHFPDTMASPDVYARLGLDSKNPKDKKTASRVMKAAGFVAKRGRRAAIWIGGRCADDGEGKLSSAPYSPPPPPHYIDGVTVTPESTQFPKRVSH